MIHKISLTIRNNQTVVSCACRALRGHNNSGKQALDPIGETKNFTQTKCIFNDPDNHYLPFTEDDMIGR